MSPFSYYAILEAHRNNITLPKYVTDRIPEIAEEEDSTSEGEETQPTNVYYNMEFLMYLIREVFSIAPLMTHMLLYLNNLSIVDETNNSGESWFDIPKNHDLEKETPLRVGRFIKRQEENMKGWKFKAVSREVGSAT